MKNIIFYIVTSMMLMSYTPNTTAQYQTENHQISLHTTRQISDIIKKYKNYSALIDSGNFDTVIKKQYSLLSSYFFTQLLQNIFLSDPSFVSNIPKPSSAAQNTHDFETLDSEQEFPETNTADLITLSELMDTLHHLEDDLEIRINNIDRHDKEEIIQILLTKKELIEARLRNRGILNIKQNPPFLKTPLGITSALLTTTFIITGITLSSFDLVRKTWEKPSVEKFRSNAHHCSSLLTKKPEADVVFFDVRESDDNTD